MRLNWLILLMGLLPRCAIAQLPPPAVPPGVTSIWYAPCERAMGVGCASAAVYDYRVADAQIAAAKKDAITQCAADVNNAITAAKKDLAKDMSNLPAAAIDALRAQMKAELKVEILNELIDEIRAGKLKVPSPVPPQKGH